MDIKKNTAVIILAAGRSTRLKSDIPKVLHPLCSRPMIEYVLDLVEDLGIKETVVVLGYGRKEVIKSVRRGIKTAVQKRLLGTADAVKAGLALLKNFKGALLVLYADNPLLTKETVSKLLKYHIENKLSATLLTAQLDKPLGYGRILRDKYSSICGIVEEKDADDFQKDIKEVNTGIICLDKDKLVKALKYVRPDNRKKEYYLTDVVSILYKEGCLIDGVRLSDINEALGINLRSDLARANTLMQERINGELMKKGVTIVSPQSAFISYGVKIGKDTVIYPFTVIEKGVKIGKHCFIGPFAHLKEGAQVKDSTLISSVFKENCGWKEELE